MASRRIESDEAYWQSSSASQIKVNLFDDSLDLQAAKRIINQSMFGDNEDDDDDDDDDSGAGGRVEFSARSARFQPQRPAPPGAARPTTVPYKRTGANESAGITRSAFAEPSLEDVVNSSVTKKQPSLSEMSKLESENLFLKRNLKDMKENRWSQLPPKDTIKRIIMGQPYCLELYKSRKDKLALLDQAILLHDGNAITAAVLFLQSTVKDSIFKMELMKRPVGVEHYITYLRLHYKIEELIDILSLLGRTEEAAMLKYKQASSIRNPDSKIRSLQTCLRTHFESDLLLSREAGLIREQISLLERQLPIEADDAAKEKRGEPLFREHPRKASVVDTPVITTLYYCCFYHYDLQENYLACPGAIRKAHKLSEKQFTWSAIYALAKKRRWKNLETLFQTKGWLGGTKMKAVVGFDRVVHLLHAIDAPRDIINKYCKLIENIDTRLEIGQKLGCHETVIEVYLQNKDRQLLQTYCSQLKTDSQAYYYAKSVLENHSIKWKN